MTSWFPIISVPNEKEARGPLTSPEEIETREGTFLARKGDYVIREADGAVYPIEPDKFREFYEVVE